MIKHFLFIYFLLFSFNNVLAEDMIKTHIYNNDIIDSSDNGYYAREKRNNYNERSSYINQENRLRKLEGKIKQLEGEIERLNFVINNFENNSRSNTMNNFSQPKADEGVIINRSKSEFLKNKRIKDANDKKKKMELPVERKFALAKELILAGDETEARFYFEDIIKLHNQNKTKNGYVPSKILGDTYYWLSQLQYSNKEYNNSALSSLSAYKLSKNINKNELAQNSLLQLAITLQQINKIKESCTTLSKLQSDYKDSIIPYVANRSKLLFTINNCALLLKKLKNDRR